MRSFVYLVLLGLILLTLAIAVRSGIYARKAPEEPINAAMRSALAETSPQFTTQDALRISRDYPTAYAQKSGLLYIARAPGSGSATPKVGDTVVANYEGRLLDGKQFYSSYAAGRPLTFEVGVGNVIKGLDEAFLTMKRGSKRTLIVPYWLGYGEAGQPPLVPPRATLVYEVELIDFN
jgi:FKBP-type peptidyl-prolyl cis-trans isomerase